MVTDLMMRFARHIALWLAAAILSVVVALAAAPASAHAGHDHAGHARAGTARVAAPVPAALVPPRVVLRRDAAPPGARAVLGSKGSATVTAPALRRHAGHARCCAACGHAGSACCAVALAPGEAPALPGPGRLADAARREVPSPAGIVPEAQAEPPRPFA